MSDPFDVYHGLMKDRPKLLHKTPRAMCRWIGRVIQQYGTEAGELRDLRAEYEGLERKLKVVMELTLKMEDIHDSLHKDVHRLDTVLDDVETHCMKMIAEVEGVPYFREVLKIMEGRQN